MVPEGLGTALKPASEHWILARKPLVGTVVDNVLEYGTGALNVDGCRVGTTKEIPGGKPRSAPQGPAYGDLSRDRGDGSGWDPNVGRWPPNLVLTHHPDCDGSCRPGCPVAEMDRQSGSLKSGKVEPHHMRRASRQKNGGGYGGNFSDVPLSGYGDQGGASRFFPRFAWEEEDFVPWRYCGKASPTDRGRDNLHPTVKPVALMRWLCRLITPPGGSVLDLFLGSGSTGVACVLEGFRFHGVEGDPATARYARERIRLAWERLRRGGPR